MRRGRGERCHGYRCENGASAFCSRGEHAGRLPFHEAAQAYKHRLHGACDCGTDHSADGGRAPSPEKRIAATYPYHDEAGRLLFEAVRFEPKGFSQRRPDGNGGWVWNLNDTRRVLYRLPELLAADPSETVYVVEGERDADNLRALGLVATTNPMGAGKWQPDYADSLKGRHVVILPDADSPGRRHGEQAATSLRGFAATVKVLELPGLPEKGDVSDWLAAGGTAQQLEQLARNAPEWRDDPAQMTGTPWDRAMTATDFLAQETPEVLWLEPDLLAPGALTEWFSPRGIGKTHMALSLASRIARTGKCVMLIDRDNPRREVQRRLRAWGADGLTTLRVICREEAPPLTDTAAWRAFPFREYDLIIVDSLDATTEGVGEQDSAKPSRALAPLLDLAHRADGPAVLVLGNTNKAGTHGRGSGVVEDRGDIVYEVRDATELKPTGTKPWWEELPAAGRDAWANRASRRKQRDRFRLAFIPTKFRIGEEPEPSIFELDLSADYWTVRDVTDDVVAEGQEAGETLGQRREGEKQAAAERLTEEITRRAAGGEQPLMKSGAEEFLNKQCHLKRAVARAIVADGEGQRWRFGEMEGKRGHKGLALLPMNVANAAGTLQPVSKATAAITLGDNSPSPPRVLEGAVFAAPGKQGGNDSGGRKPVPDKGFSAPTSCRPLKEPAAITPDAKALVPQGFPKPRVFAAVAPQQVGGAVTNDAGEEMGRWEA